MTERCGGGVSYNRYGSPRKPPLSPTMADYDVMKDDDEETGHRPKQKSPRKHKEAAHDSDTKSRAASDSEERGDVCNTISLIVFIIGIGLYCHFLYAVTQSDLSDYHCSNVVLYFFVATASLGLGCCCPRFENPLLLAIRSVELICGIFAVGPGSLTCAESSALLSGAARGYFFCTLAVYMFIFLYTCFCKGKD